MKVKPLLVRHLLRDRLLPREISQSQSRDCMVPYEAVLEQVLLEDLSLIAKLRPCPQILESSLLTVKMVR